jgi:hypothetical protein
MGLHEVKSKHSLSFWRPTSRRSRCYCLSAGAGHHAWSRTTSRQRYSWTLEEDVVATAPVPPCRTRLHFSADVREQGWLRRQARCFLEGGQTREKGGGQKKVVEHGWQLGDL